MLKSVYNVEDLVMLKFLYNTKDTGIMHIAILMNDCQSHGPGGRQ